MTNPAIAGLAPRVPPHDATSDSHGGSAPCRRSTNWTRCTGDPRSGRRDEQRGVLTTAGALATLAGVAPGVAVAGITTITTTQEYSGTASSQGTTASFDVLFTPVQNATDLVSISAGSVYTGEASALTIEVIRADDSTIIVSGPISIMDFFQTVPLSDITNNEFTDFSEQEIKGLRFSIENIAGFGETGYPSITLPVGTDFLISSVPEPGAGVMLVCSLAAVLISRSFTRLVPAHPRR